MKVRSLLQWETSDRQLEKFRRVLLAALETEYYFPRLQAAGLAAPDAIAGICSVSEGLERLPAGDVRAFLDDSDRFRNRAMRCAPVQLELEGVTPNAWRRRLGFRANVVAGPFSALERLADDVQRGATGLAAAVRRITVHSRVDRELLRDAERDLLWRAFRLPVFEEVRGLDNELLAWECDAHAGLHVDAECAIAEASGLGGGGELVLTSLAGLHYPMLRMLSGLVGRCTGGMCECGERSNRVIFPPRLRKPPLMERAGFDFGSRGAVAQ
jgi:hypothetical protein